MSAAPGRRPDLLAVDHPSALAVNRGVYRAIAALGPTVELAVPERLPHLPGQPPCEAALPGDPPLHRLVFRGRNLRYLRIDGLQALLERRQPRAVHLNNEPDTPLARRLGAWCRRNGALLTTQSADSELFPLAQSLRRGEARHLLRGLRTRLSLPATRGRVDAVFCLTGQIAGGWQRLGLGERVRRMPLGVDCARFRPDEAARAAVRAQLGLRHPTVAYFGRLIPKKGVHELVAALCRLPAREWQFLANDWGAAEGYAAHLWDPLRAAGLDDRRLSVRPRHEEVADYMRAADVVVVPSLWEEQYGRVAAEALACGTPVVAYRRGGLPEVVGEAGLLLPSGEVAALASTLDRLLGDAAERRRLGALGRAHALERLSLERQAAAMVEALEELWRVPR